MKEAMMEPLASDRLPIPFSVGCIQVTLSNGNTMEQEPAKWALVGLSFLALISSLVHSIIAQSVGAAQWRVVDVFMTIQHVAITALVSVSFPQAFVSFALNFAWSIGLVTLGGLQSSLTSTREATGGSDTAVLGQGLIAQLGRDTSVWLEAQSPASPGSTLDFINSLAMNLVNGSQDTPAAHQGELSALTANTSHFRAISPYPGMGYWKRAALYAPNTGAGGYTVTQTSTGTLPLISNSSDTATGGLVVLAQRAGIPADNVFMTMLVSMFIFIGIILAAIGVTLLIVSLFRLLTTKSENTTAHWSRRVTRPSEVGYLVAAFMGRALLVIFPVFCIFAFYQWRFGDSWVPDFLAAIFMAFLLVAIAIFFVPLFKNARRASSRSLYYESTPPVLANRATKRWGHMAHPYRPRFFWFALAFLAMSVARACFIGFAQGDGFVQSVGLLVLEVLFFLVLCIFRVGRDKKSDAVFIVLGIFRIASWAVCIALTSRAGLTYIPRVIVGFVIIVVTGLPVVYVFIFLVVMDLVSPFRPSKLRGKHWRGEQREDLQTEKTTGEKARDSLEGRHTYDTAAAGQSTFPETTAHSASSASGETSIDASPVQTTAPPTAFSTAVNAGGSGGAQEGEAVSSRVA